VSFEWNKNEFEVDGTGFEWVNELPLIGYDATYREMSRLAR